VPAVRISSVSDRVRIIAENRNDITVDGDARIQVDGDRTTVDHVKSRLTVRVPLGTDVVIGTTSGRVEVAGAVGAASVVTESGRIEIEEAASLDARTTSARVQVGRVSGRCRVRNKSGRVEVGACGGADVATKSGRIDLQHVTGPVEAHCVSGRIEIRLDTSANVDAETVSGRISVHLPDAARPHRVEGPMVFGDPPDGCDCTVRAASVSGRVEVTPS